MLKAQAVARGVRHSELKLRQVADLVRGKSVDDAFAVLGVMREYRKGAKVLENVLKSAVANLQQTEAGAAVGTDAISVSKVCIDKGPMMKRIQPRAQGRAFRIEKKLSHVTVEVSAEV